MNLQQQQQDPHTQELEEWQIQEPGIEQKQIHASYIMIVVAVIGAAILIPTFIAYHVAIVLQELPKIHLQPLQQAYVQTIDHKNNGKLLMSKPNPQFSTILKQVPIREFSPSILVQVEQSNSVHRGYQYSIRKFEFQNAKLALQEFSFRQFSQNSRMTYNNYLEALKAFRINAFPIRDSSQELKALQKQTKQYFFQKYNLGRRLSENNLCIIVELTKQGLQSGKYYYTLKSIFQQNYKNYKLIVINYPEMQQRQQVQNLLSTFEMKDRIILFDKFQTANKLQSSIFVYNSIKQCCSNSAMTIIQKDTGQLIGKQVFSIIDQTIHTQNPDLIITSYILESANPLRQKLTETRYKVSLSSLYLHKPRQMPYKTKYLKVIKTSILMELGEKPFTNVNGGWINGLFQANLQFSTIQYSCGNVVQLQQILYKSSQKTEIENAAQILDTRKQPQQNCRIKDKQTKEKETSRYIPNIIQKPSFELADQIPQQNPNSLFIRSIETLTEQQIQAIQLNFQEQSFSRKLLYNTVNQKYIEANDSKISGNSGISFKSLFQATNQLKLYTQSIITQNTNIIKNPKSKITQVQQPKKQQKTSFNHSFSNSIEFCLIMTIQNNQNDFSHLYTTESIIMQDYQRFRLFIIDNLSSDLTAKSMKNHISKISQVKRKNIKFYKTKQKKSRAEILYNSIKQFCNPNDVVITLNSGQILIDKNTLLKLNEEYNKKRALSIYSNSFSILNQTAVIGPSAYPKYTIIQDKSLDQKVLFAYSLLSYRAYIFQSLRFNDFKDKDGNWMTKGEDQIISFGIQQLSCNSIYYLNEILIFLPLTPQSKLLQTNKSKYNCLQSAGKLLKNP